MQTLLVDHPSEEDDDTVYVWVNFGMASLYVLKVLSSEMDSAEIRNLLQDGERSDFSEKPPRLSLFKDDLSNEPNFDRIHLAGKYL